VCRLLPAHSLIGNSFATGAEIRAGLPRTGLKFEQYIMSRAVRLLEVTGPAALDSGGIGRDVPPQRHTGVMNVPLPIRGRALQRRACGIRIIVADNLIRIYRRKHS
jgi:hypothetical protein